MIYAILIGLVATVALVLRWRDYRLARNPATWSESMTLKRQIKLANLFLKSEGWQLQDINRPLNIFVRAKRGSVWLSMMIHNEQETLSLPTLMADCISKHAGKGSILGILSHRELTGQQKADADHNGIYVIKPADLKDVAGYIRKAAARRKQLAAIHETAELPTALQQ